MAKSGKRLRKIYQYSPKKPLSSMVFFHLSSNDKRAYWALDAFLYTAQKLKFSIKDFFISKCDQIYSFLRIWSHLLKKSLMGNVIFCAVVTTQTWGQKSINTIHNFLSYNFFEKPWKM